MAHDVTIASAATSTHSQLERRRSFAAQHNTQCEPLCDSDQSVNTESNTDMARPRTVKGELAFLRRAMERRGILPLLLATEEAYFEVLFEDFQQYRPPAEALKCWKDVITSVRKMCWLELALKSMEEKYLKLMLTTIATPGPSSEEATSHLIHPRYWKDYQGERRARLRAVVKVARGVAKINAKHLPQMKKDAARSARRRIVNGNTESSELEIVYKDLLTFQHHLKSAIKAYEK